MIRRTHLLWAGLTVFVAGILFFISNKVDERKHHLASVENEILRVSENLHVLRAEWSFLNDPERLRDLSSLKGEMETIRPDHYVAVAALPNRPEPEPEPVLDPAEGLGDLADPNAVDGLPDAPGDGEPEAAPRILAAAPAPPPPTKPAPGAFKPAPAIQSLPVASAAPVITAAPESTPAPVSVQEAAPIVVAAEQTLVEPAPMLAAEPVAVPAAVAPAAVAPVALPAQSSGATPVRRSFASGGGWAPISLVPAAAGGAQ
ncbi:MAG: cell division protein FtsL [Rhodospirillaceae bacterium]